MQRYFVLEDTNWTDHQVTITGDDVHHIKRVMRGKPSDHIICNNNDGKAARCEIAEIANESVTATIVEWLKEEKELPVEITIAQGLPKGDKLELILQKGTELGAAGFIPFVAERSIVVWDEKKMRKKVARYQKIVKEASEQSHRQQIPLIENKMDLKQLIAYSKQFNVCLFAYEQEAKRDGHHSFATALKTLQPGQRVLLAIGPEGGFSEQEAERLEANNFQAVRFGPRILRTETAALYALASMSYHFEELRWNECAP